MRPALLAVVVVVAVVAVSAAQQPRPAPAELPSGLQPQGVTNPHYRPEKTYDAASICGWFESVIDQYDRVVERVSDSNGGVLGGWDLEKIQVLTVSMSLDLAKLLMDDARAQDPRFQCYWWDFSGEEAARLR